jgi:hypothetical protein
MHIEVWFKSACLLLVADTMADDNIEHMANKGCGIDDPHIRACTALRSH